MDAKATASTRPSSRPRWRSSGAASMCRVNSGDECDIVHIQTMGLESLRQLLRARERAVVTAHIVPESLVGSFTLAPLWLPIGDRVYVCVLRPRRRGARGFAGGALKDSSACGWKLPVRLCPTPSMAHGSGPNPAGARGCGPGVAAKDAFVVMCVGQMQPRKGCDPFVETARPCPTSRSCGSAACRSAAHGSLPSHAENGGGRALELPFRRRRSLSDMPK